jgi:hypothetical protein
VPESLTDRLTSCSDAQDWGGEELDDGNQGYLQALRIDRLVRQTNLLQLSGTGDGL